MSYIDLHDIQGPTPPAGRNLAHSYYDEIEAYRNRHPVKPEPRRGQVHFVISVLILYIALGAWILSLLGVIHV